jgi:hypothetical protein
MFSVEFLSVLVMCFLWASFLDLYREDGVCAVERCLSTGSNGGLKKVFDLKQVAWTMLQLGHYRFLPDAFHFIVHQLSYQCTPRSSGYRERRSIKSISSVNCVTSQLL